MKRLGGVLVLACALTPAILVAVPAAQAATVCDAANPCLPQDVAFTSVISSGAGFGFSCGNITSGFCVRGYASVGNVVGIAGTASGGFGVYGSSSTADGVYGTGGTDGVFGITSLNGTSHGGVYGSNSSTGSFAVGVRGRVAGDGYGGYFDVGGASGWGIGAYGGERGVDATGSRYGVDAAAAPGADHAGVNGAIASSAANAAGVRGSNSGACCGMGVAGFHSGQGIGVYGEAQNGFAVSGFSPNNWSGYFQGSVNVVGTLFKSSGAFRIDHPLDPAHKYLQHSFVESPDMMNIYNGNVTTNGKGFATIKLPAWFSALNKDFRYQLTPLGHNGWGARAVVWDEIHNNRFTIRSEPHVKISWQVTGVRHDAYANAHRIQTVVPKTGSAEGKYVHPELYGKPMTKSVVVLPGMDGKGNSKLAHASGKG